MRRGLRTKRCDMSDLPFAVSAGDASVEHLESTTSGTLQVGDKIGPVQVAVCNARNIELRVPGELSWGPALVGLVPIVWCAAAWTLCLREHLLAERMRGCMALTLMAAVSALLMVSSLGVSWRFDGKRRRITRRVGLLGSTHN